MTAPWFSVATHFKGLAEVHGATDNPKIVEMFRISGHPEVKDDETPWCAAFVGACLRLSGYLGSSSLGARSYQNFGQDLGTTPRRGCIAVFTRGDPQHGHVAFLDHEEDDDIYVLGGNQSDAVTLTRFPKSRWLAYRWPTETAPLPETTLPTILQLDPESAPPHVLAGHGQLLGLPWISIRHPGAAGIAAKPGAQRFATCIALVLRDEGGNDDDPRDPGGRTSRGILQREWDAWRETHPGLPSDVWQAPQDQVLAIYREKYWNALSCDDLPAGVDYAVMDYGVNSGIVRTAKILQRFVGAQVDGEIGPQTIAATAVHDPATLVKQICDERLTFLQGLNTWATFGRGWTRRVQGVRSAALGMVEAAPVIPPTGQWPVPADTALAQILQRLKALENLMTAGPASPTTPPLPQIDLARIEQDIARLGQITGTFSQFVNTLGQPPTTGLPPQVAQIEQSITRLGQIAGTLSQFAASLSVQAPAAGATAPQLSPIDKLLGGPALVGLKTPIAIFGYAGLWILQSLNAVGTAAGDKATTTGSVLTALFSALGAAGVTAKFDRAFKAISAISGGLQRLSMQPPAAPPKVDS